MKTITFSQAVQLIKASHAIMMDGKIIPITPLNVTSRDGNNKIIIETSIGGIYYTFTADMNQSVSIEGSTIKLIYNSQNHEFSIKLLSPMSPDIINFILN